MINETEITDQCKRGDNIARKKLYETYAEKMMGICFRYTGDKEVAQDLLHDGFIKVFTSIDSFSYRGDGSLRAWMSRVFINTALEYLRKNDVMRHSTPLEDYQEKDFFSEAEDLSPVPTDVLMNFVLELPIGYRTIFNMYVFDEMPHKEIAKNLNIQEGSSRSQLARAKTLLQKKVKKYIDENNKVLTKMI